MANEDVSEWEKHKFSVETKLKERELELSKERLKVENRRNVLITALVPIVVALMSAVPAYVNSRTEHSLQEAAFEAQLITDSMRTGDPDQAAANLAFLVEAGLLSDDTGSKLAVYLAQRQQGTGRALPGR